MKLIALQKDRQACYRRTIGVDAASSPSQTVKATFGKQPDNGHKLIAVIFDEHLKN